MTRRGFSTRAIHNAPRAAPIRSTPLAPPLVQSASFAFEGIEALSEALGHPERAFAYTRASNPTVDQLERAVADLEGAEAGVSFSSGVAAIHAVATTFLSAGDHVVAQRALYGGSHAIFAKVLAPMGIETTYVDHEDLGAWQAALRPRTRLLYAETIGNPTLAVPDLRRLGELARGAGARLAVDSTFATPFLCRPVELGASIVLHSVTKYLGGHGDVVGGIALAGAADAALLRRTRALAGGNPSPFDAWLVLRGLKTLALRMARHSASALELARRLEAHPRVERVLYPGLATHPDHAMAAERLPDGQGGVVAFEPRGVRAVEVVDRVELFQVAGSLGDAHSLVMIPAMVSHKNIEPDERRRSGIGDDLIRLSVGLEDPADLAADLIGALESAPAR